jgi:transcription elongation factor Elf1
MTKPGHGHRTKRCPRCGKTKTVRAANFTYATVDGKRFFKHCRICDHAMKARARELRTPEQAAAIRDYKREWQRRQYAKDPEPQRAASRKWKAKLKAEDPERYFETAILSRRFEREGRNLALGRAKTIEPYAERGRGKEPVVPAAPLVNHLREAFPGWSPGEVSSYLGVPSKRIYDLLTEQVDQVLLSTADLILTAGLARPDLLNAFYPYEGRAL